MMRGFAGTPIPDRGLTEPDYHATSMADFAKQVQAAKLAHPVAKAPAIAGG